MMTLGHLWVQIPTASSTHDPLHGSGASSQQWL